MNSCLNVFFFYNYLVQFLLISSKDPRRGRGRPESVCEFLRKRGVVRLCVADFAVTQLKVFPV
jgi:hypothetical protein